MRSIYCFLSIGLILASCSATPVKKVAPQKASSQQQQDFKAAKAAAQKGDQKVALQKLTKLVQQNPQNDLADQSLLLAGDLLFNNQQYAAALEKYDAIPRLQQQSSLILPAQIRATKCLVKLQKYAEANKLAQGLIDDSRPLSAEQTLDLLQVRFDSLRGMKKDLDSTEILITLHSRAIADSERNRYRAIGLDLVESTLNESDLRTVAGKSFFSFLRPSANMRLGLMAADKKEYSTARDFFATALELDPNGPLAEKAKSYLAQIDSRQKVSSQTIGVVLPLSGNNQSKGYRILHGIQLGLGIYGRMPSHFRLAVIDSEGNPDVARKGVERLVIEDNVIAIIGGLLSKTVTAEATKAQQYGVPFIALTQKTGITQIGSAVFLNSLTSEMIVKALVDTAMSQLEISRFAIMYPNDAYGIEYANLFWDEVKAKGGQITAAQPYDPNEKDFSGHAQRLVGTFYTDDRAEEFKLKLTAWQEKNQKRTARTVLPTFQELVPAAQDFDAVFIADSPKAVQLIAPTLEANGISGARLLGTNIWNTPKFIELGKKYVEDSVFVGSTTSNDPSFLNSEFFSSYKSTFDETPGFSEVQGYDSGLILRQLIGLGENSRSGLIERLSRLQEFPGAMGRLSMSPERELRLPIAALTVQGGRIQKLHSSRE